MKKVIALVNQKGGVGKTTTAINLASCLGIIMKKRVLLVDLDPQGNTSTALGINQETIDKNNIYKILIGQNDIKNSIVKTNFKNLSIIPSDNNLAGADVELINSISREQKLKQSLEKIEAQFDYILIDCPPSLGLLTINGLNASDKCLVPIQPEIFSLGGVSQLLKTVDLVKENLNPNLSIKGILITMYDKRNNLHKEMKKLLEEYFKNSIFKTVIPRNIKLSESPNHEKPIIEYDLKSKGSIAYINLCKELFDDGEFDKYLNTYLNKKEITLEVNNE